MTAFHRVILMVKLDYFSFRLSICLQKLNSKIKFCDVTQSWRWKYYLS